MKYENLSIVDESTSSRFQTTLELLNKARRHKLAISKIITGKHDMDTVTTCYDGRRDDSPHLPATEALKMQCQAITRNVAIESAHFRRRVPQAMREDTFPRLDWIVDEPVVKKPAIPLFRTVAGGIQQIDMVTQGLLGRRRRKRKRPSGLVRSQPILCLNTAVKPIRNGNHPDVLGKLTLSKRVKISDAVSQDDHRATSHSLMNTQSDKAKTSLCLSGESLSLMQSNKEIKKDYTSRQTLKDFA